MSESKKEKEGFIMMNKMIGLRIVVLLILICLMILPTAFAETELAKGSKGVEVSIIQSWLNLLGYNAGTANGIFGNETYEAVIQFQENNSLESTGIVDTATRATIKQHLTNIDNEYYSVAEVDEFGKIKYGFANRNGEIVIPCEWDGVYAFSEGLAAVARKDEKGSPKHGYINSAGELIIPCEWSSHNDFSEGLVVVYKYGENNEKNGYMTASGELVIPCIWRYAESFSQGLAAVRDEIAGCGYINYDGALVLNFNEGQGYSFSEGLAAWSGCYYNLSGEKVITMDGYYCGAFSEGLADVAKLADDKKSVGKSGFINTNGELVIPCEWDEAYSFNEGLASVIKDGKSGFIDRTGSLVIACEWDRAYTFYRGLAKVMKNGKYGFINTAGELIIPCEWDSAGNFTREYASVTRGDEAYWIDINGDIRIDKGVNPITYRAPNSQTNSKHNDISYEKMAANCIKVCQSMAKDPSSLQIHGIKYFQLNNNYVFVMDVTGANSFGGASRQTFACYVNPKTGTATYDSYTSSISYNMYAGTKVDIAAALALVK